MTPEPTPQRSTVIVVGALCVDDIAKPLQNLLPAASNPVSWRQHVGGVAANVARVLSEQFETHLISMIGDDSAGRHLTRAVNATGIKTHLIVGERPTGRYTAVLDERGELFVGLADTAGTEDITWQDVQALQSNANCVALVVDANLDHACMEATLAKAQASQSTSSSSRGLLTIVLAVSPAKARRCLQAATDIDLLFCNRAEAAALTKLPLTTSLDTFADALQTAGFTGFVISDGANAALAQSQRREHVPVQSITISNNVNGAGDAMAAASVAGVLSGHDLIDSVTRFGMPAAADVLNGKRSPLPL